MPPSVKLDRWRLFVCNLLSSVMLNKGQVIGEQERLGIVISLHHVTAQLLEHFQLSDSFHALLDNVHAQGFCDMNDLTQNHAVALCGNSLLEEKTVQLDLIHLYLFQNVIGRISRTEIVYGAKESVSAHVIDGAIHTLVILIGKALGKLQGQHAIGNMVPILHIGIIFLEIRLNGSDTGNIDRYGIYQLLSLDGLGNIAAYLFVHEMVQLDNESVCLKDGQEGCGSTIDFLLGIIPTNQRFTAFHTVLDNVKFWLIEHHKLKIGKQKV